MAPLVCKKCRRMICCPCAHKKCIKKMRKKIDNMHDLILSLGKRIDLMDSTATDLNQMT